MLHAGVARTDLTPFHGVELTGWGYYLERTWRSIHDPLKATALAVTDQQRQVIVIALDLMVIDQSFATRTRSMIHDAIGVPPSSVMITCSHSHNAPAAGGLLGVGQCDPFYEDWASRQAATAAILAWHSLEPATVSAAACSIDGITFNRTRDDGVVDSRMTVARIDREDGSPMVMLVGFAAHPTVCTELRPRDISRDVPGEVCDIIEADHPGVTAMYIQGACGDTNFLREFGTADRRHEPARRIADAAQLALDHRVAMDEPKVASASRVAELPTRRWTRDEIERDRNEAKRRIADNSIANWRATIGRSMTNRPDDMISRHGGDERKAVMAMCRFHIEWTDLVLRDLDTRPEVLETEVQAVRIGDIFLVANSSEFFSPFALDIRRRTDLDHLMFACYANGRIGYLPDEHDIEAKSYAAYQSPKYCNQFPFTAASGPAMCDAMLAVIDACR